MANLIHQRLETASFKFENSFALRGRAIANTATCKAFDKELVIGRCGPVDQVVGFLPALTIDTDRLNQGLEIIFERPLIETLDQARP